jgi:transposase
LKGRDINMLGRTDRQLTFSDMWLEDKIPSDSYYARMHNWVMNSLTDDMFQGLYSYYGRPSASPIYSMVAILIQAEKGYSDLEMEGASRFDDRVKYAMTAPRDYKGIDAVTLCESRQRFFQSDIGRELFIKVLKQAKEAKMFDENNINAIDSFMIYGSAARQSTYTMIYLGIKSILKLCQFYNFKSAAVKVLGRTDYQLDIQKPKIDWEDKEEKSNLIDLLVKDATALINFVKSVIKIEYCDLIYAYELLEKVIQQDTELGENGKYKITEGTAKDRIISINDPEMRHGRKTSAKLHDGFKGEIITGGENSELVVAFDVMPANVPDGRKMGELIDQATENGQDISKLYGDSAYNDREEINKRKDEIEIVAKIPAAVNKNGLYSKDDFTIDMETGVIECPDGKSINFDPESIPDKGKAILFGCENCEECEKKDFCTKSKNGRSVHINKNEAEILDAKAFQKTVEFKEDYAKRSNVERTISELTKHGARQGRYIGVDKIRFQLLISALNHNVKKLMRFILRKKKDVGLKTGYLCSN